MKKIFWQSILSILFCCALSGCALLFPARSPSSSQYVLDPHPHVMSAPRSNKTLLVLSTQGIPPYNSTKIVYTTTQHQIGYYSQHNWATFPSQMLTSLIAQSLRQSGHYRAVAAAPFAGLTNLQLNTQLLTFQQEFYAGHSEFHIILAAQLVSAQTNLIIASRQWDISEPAPANNPYGGVIAANHAVSVMLTKLVRFCIGAS